MAIYWEGYLLMEPTDRVGSEMIMIFVASSIPERGALALQGNLEMIRNDYLMAEYGLEDTEKRELAEAAVEQKLTTIYKCLMDIPGEWFETSGYLAVYNPGEPLPRCFGETTIPVPDLYRDKIAWYLVENTLD